jgi:thiamine biosynthesis protein ThiS
MHLVINGKERDFPALSAASKISDLIIVLELKTDRVALEHNGMIIRRDAWPETQINSGDKFEIVHFVGGGRS